MNRIAQLVSIGTEDELGGNQEQAESADTVGMSL
jgi:hypothetical protein